MHEIITSAQVHGLVRGGYVIDGVWTPQPNAESNLVLFDWATVAANLLSGSLDGKPYKLAAMYLEYENNGGAAVTPPSFDRSGNQSYYAGLSSSATIDYLRMPLSAITKTSSDLVKYPGGNRLSVMAQSGGAAGVHGKPFNATVKSRVFGCALVVCPDFADVSQDLVFSRYYWSAAASQLVKTTSSEIGIGWEITLD